MNNLEKWVWFSEALYKGSRKANELLSHFGDIEKIYTADRTAFKASGVSFGEKELERLLDKSLDASAKILSDCEKNGIRVILRTSREFPKRLLEIADCPVLLYAKGMPLSVDDEPVISVVGTRKASVHGIGAAKKISAEIATSGGVLCSGLARGIDTVAMESALSRNGKVLGVLGNGLDIAYPAENRNLMKQIEYLTSMLYSQLGITDAILNGTAGEMEMQNYYTVAQILEFMDVILPQDTAIAVNNAPTDRECAVYENFTVVWGDEAENIARALREAEEEAKRAEEEAKRAAEEALRLEEEARLKEELAAKEAAEAEKAQAEKTVTDAEETKSQETDATASQKAETNAESAETSGNAEEAAEDVPPAPVIHDIWVIVNGAPLKMSGKAAYVYVDVFDYIEFDLTKPQGSGIHTTLNGVQAEYLKEIFDGDVIEVYWKK